LYIEGQLCFKSVSGIKEKINTVTLYANPYRFRGHIEEVIQANSERIILNPGTEDNELEKRIEVAGINVCRTCTLVLLSTG
jgi:predicted CoA-binding protein